jgi:hypothetical protein
MLLTARKLLDMAWRIYSGHRRVRLDAVSRFEKRLARPKNSQTLDQDAEHFGLPVAPESP